MIAVILSQQAVEQGSPFDDDNEALSALPSIGPTSEPSLSTTPFPTAISTVEPTEKPTSISSTATVACAKEGEHCPATL